MYMCCVKENLFSPNARRTPLRCSAIMFSAAGWTDGAEKVRMICAFAILSEHDIMVQTFWIYDTAPNATASARPQSAYAGFRRTEQTNRIHDDAAATALWKCKEHWLNKNLTVCRCGREREKFCIELIMIAKTANFAHAFALRCVDNGMFERVCPVI